MQKSYFDHYTKLLNQAKTVLSGPKGIAIDDTFWGGRLLSLFVMRIPKIEGVIESRIVYANSLDPEQAKAILRCAKWDAGAVQAMTKADSDLRRAPSIREADVLLHSVWVDRDWVNKITTELEQITIPMRWRSFQSSLKLMYQLRYERVDNTMVDLVWKADTEEEFTQLSQTWCSLWEQMDSLLLNSHEVTYHEYTVN